MTCRRVIRLALLVVACGTSVAATPVSPSERANTFATCAGRHAAAETYWGRVAEGNTQSSTFDALTDAVLPSAVAYGMPASHAADAKFRAWLDHAYLRNDAEFAVDPGRRARARARLDRDLAECSALIL